MTKKNLLVKLLKESLKEAEIDNPEIINKIAYFHDLQNKIDMLSSEVSKYEAEFKGFEELLRPLMDSMVEVKDKVAKTNDYIINITRAGGTKSTYSYQKAFEAALTKVNGVIKKILEDELEATKKISSVKHSFKIGKLSEASILSKGKAFITKLVNKAVSTISDLLTSIDSANKVLSKLAAPKESLKESVEYKGRAYTTQNIKDMREWISDCQWEDLDDVDDLSDMEVIKGVDRNYEGGLKGFDFKGSMKNEGKQVEVDVPEFVEKELKDLGHSNEDLHKKAVRAKLSTKAKEWIRDEMMPKVRTEAHSKGCTCSKCSKK